MRPQGTSRLTVPGASHARHQTHRLRLVQRGFDRQLLKMWAMTENEYGVLSTYVGNAKQDLNTGGEVVIGHPRYTVPVICSVIRILPLPWMEV